ncbi:hypothetical protein MKX03_005362 [Papaver bracteatum]|nr:hypothetical protein MKX03_005362 [Papaver bracteatum]
MASSSCSSASESDQPQVPKFKIALCQISVSLDKKTNIDRARKMIKDAAKMGAKLIVLPEMWNCPYANENFPIYAEDFDNRELSPSLMMLSDVARSEGVTVVGGSIPERCGERLYNTCCVFGTDGNLIAKHRKESETITAGNRPTIVDTDVGRIGIGICHDLRFSPNLQCADLICYPGAFNMSTGNLFWELLETLSGSYLIWGHSTLVGPVRWNFRDCNFRTEETTVIAEIDYSMYIYQFIDCTNELNSQQ